MNGSGLTSGRSAGSHERTLQRDRILFAILLGHLPFSMFLIPIGHGTGAFAFYASALVGLMATAAFALLRGTPSFGLMSGLLLMSLSAIMIQSQLGRIEMHLHIPIALAALLIHKNRINILAAASFIGLHHLAFTAMQLKGVGFDDTPILLFNYGCSWETAVWHLAFIAIETLLLVYYATLMRADERQADRLSEALLSVDAHKDLTLRLPDNGKVASVAAFNATIAQFATLAQEVADAATRIQSLSFRIDDIGAAATTEIGTRQAQAERAVTAFSALSQAMAQVAERTRLAASIAGMTSEQALDGHERFNRAARSTAELQQLMAEAAAASRRLETEAHAMDAVAKVIRDLSERIDRLALQSAGESGPDVAATLGALALEAQASTLDIQSLIERIRRTIEDTVATTDAGQRKTTETSSHILQAGLALNEILESVSEISDMSAEAARAAQEQGQAAETIRETLVDLAGKNSGFIEKTKPNRDSAATLRSLADTLKRSLSGYRY